MSELKDKLINSVERKNTDFFVKKQLSIRGIRHVYTSRRKFENIDDQSSCGEIDHDCKNFDMDIHVYDSKRQVQHYAPNPMLKRYFTIFKDLL